MKGDPIATVCTLMGAHASLAAAANRDETAVDCGTSGPVKILINVSSVGTGGVLTWKVQYSDDNSSFTDEPDTAAGNQTTGTISAAGLTEVDVPNPRGRYLRINGAAATDAVVFSTVGVQSPARHVVAA